MYLTTVLRHPLVTVVVLALTVALNVYLFILVPKGFFPQQDNGTIFGGLQGPQDASFQSMQAVSARVVNIVKTDPAIQNVIAFTGGGGATNGGFIYLALKPGSFRMLLSRVGPHFTRSSRLSLWMVY